MYKFPVSIISIFSSSLNIHIHVGSGSRRAIPLMIQIARQEGPRYLFKGLLPRLIAVPLYMSVYMTVNGELSKYILGRRIVA